jgi:hypothetical protein
VVYDHYKAGTIDSLYKSIVENTVIEMMLMPLRRHERGLPLLDDPESISKDVNTIANIIGTVCSKSTTAVEIDLMAAVHDFPADDVRQASVLRKNNLLC